MRESVHTNTSLRSKGMMAVIAAQFLSAFGDNALLFATLALMKQLYYPEWSQPVLQMLFVGAYILFAPFVGQFADSFAKGRVMMVANGLKLLGAGCICFGVNPFIGYTLVGIGAAAYSPAKYGILGELTTGDKLVKANGLMESSTIAAILLESIPGTAGILVPPAGYMQGVRALADEFGIVLILDEVMAGFGRTGSWFAFEQDGVVPDLVTFAKGVNAGYVPAGGVLISEPIARYFDDHFFAGGLTYSGHPLAMAAIVATIDAMKEEKVVENAASIGNEVLRPGLEALAEKHAIIGEVRGRGLFQALELVSDRAKKTPLAAGDMAEIKGALTEAGLLSFVVENRIHVVPPCTITAEQVQKGLGILHGVLGNFAHLAKS